MFFQRMRLKIYLNLIAWQFFIFCVPNCGHFIANLSKIINFFLVIKIFDNFHVYLITEALQFLFLSLLLFCSIAIIISVQENDYRDSLLGFFELFFNQNEVNFSKCISL